VIGNQAAAEAALKSSVESGEESEQRCSVAVGFPQKHQGSADTNKEVPFDSMLYLPLHNTEQTANLASSIYGFKAYPRNKEIATAVEALVAKHHCLKEAGSETGWKNSIKFKMGNYRNKMRWAGC